MAPKALLLATLPAALVVGVAPVSAGETAYAGEVRSAVATFQLGGRDGRTWLVGLTVDELHPVGGTPSRSLDVSLRPCSVERGSHVRCGRATQYRVALAPGEAGIAADLGSAFLRTRSLGALLHVKWRVGTDDQTSTIADVDRNGATIRHLYDGGAGSASGTVLGPRCAATGGVGGGFVVRTDYPPARDFEESASLPAALRAARGWRPACV